MTTSTLRCIDKKTSKTPAANGEELIASRDLQTQNFKENALPLESLITKVPSVTGFFSKKYRMYCYNDA